MRKRKVFDLSSGAGYQNAVVQYFTYLEFLHKETRISPEIQKDFVIQVLHKSLDLPRI